MVALASSSAQAGQVRVIPSSMGASLLLCEGLAIAKAFVVAAIVLAATKGVECRQDKDVIDETLSPYKDIDKVMAAQSDLVEIVYTLKQVVCVKG